MEEATMDAQRPRSPGDAPRRPPGRPRRTRDEERTIATVQRNALEEVRVRLSRFKGNDLVDVRIFAEPDDSEDRRPTKRGIALNVVLLPKLLEALHLAEEEARKAGLLG